MRKLKPTSLRRRGGKKTKEAYDRLRCHQSFRRYFSGHFFEGVKFKPLYSDEILECTDQVSIYTLDGAPCIGMPIGEVYHPVFHRGKVAEVFMDYCQKKQVEEKMNRHDCRQEFIIGLCTAIKNSTGPVSI